METVVKIKWDEPQKGIYKVEFSIDNLTKENFEKLIEKIKKFSMVKDYKASSELPWNC